MSLLLEKLRAELVSANDPSRRAELYARIAAYCARTGDFDVCRTCISELRAHYGAGQDGRVTIWIMLAEGLLQYYSELSLEALDRLSRALLLAVSAKYQPAIGVLAAWKAHIEFEMAHYEPMYRSLELCLANVLPGDADAQTRLAMVISNLAMLGGDDDTAKSWFLRGRSFAVPNGDQASIEALLYNRVAFRFTDLRAQYCRDNIDISTVVSFRREVDSATNLQELTNITALGNHIRLVSARLALLAEDFPTAISRLQVVRQEQPFASHNFSQHFIDLEVALCLFSLGDRDAALALHQAVDTSCFETLDLDEQLVASWIQRRLSEADPRFGDFKVLHTRWQEFADQYGAFQSEIRLRLGTLIQHHEP